ncbi:Rv3654c family TadE-like protein [Frondihabitans sp. VKM Ac-2883]|uniref:Rv3654c family TadE-like protein n=1 Tax=Frondihabitans sp. VKM Ac-2883 TaxID=2783823 RepID=UPI00188C72AC|nr:hypothetical protein [Frondihabitans sp. VKM Ac-2883]
MAGSSAVPLAKVAARPGRSAYMQCSLSGWADARGSVSVVLAGAIAAATLLVQAVVASGSLLVARHALAATADSASLAAADAAVGLRPGSPCEAAAALAEAQSAGLDACQVEGDTVTVRVSRGVGLVPLAAVATAGQPPGSLGAPTVGSKE